MGLLERINRHCPRLGPYERLLYEGRVRVGSFMCDPRHAGFADSGPIRGYLIVFPFLPVKIHHPRRPPLLADANTITLYNHGQRYRREAVSQDGDRCIWLGFGREDVRDAVARIGLAHPNMDSGPLAWTHSRCPREAFLLQRRLLSRLLFDSLADEFEIEDSAMRLLELALRNAIDADPRRDWRRASPKERRHLDLAHAAAAVLAQRPAGSRTLAELAGDLLASPFHLSRVFRATFGLPLHQYLTRLRVRHATDCMLDSPNARLTDLAMDAGYATPSHMTHAFRNYLGHTPSGLRKLLTGVDAQDSASKL